MRTLKSLLTDNRGLTLIELMVAATMAVVVMIPVYDTLLMGNHLQHKAFGQVDVQEKGQELLNQIIEGKYGVSPRIGGLRQATEVICRPEGLAFVVPGGSQNVMLTYYKAGSVLYYKETPFSGPMPDFLADGGTAVLDHVASFAVVENTGHNGNKAYKVTIGLDKHLPDGGANEAVLSTEVVSRNL